MHPYLDLRLLREREREMEGDWALGKYVERSISEGEADQSRGHCHSIGDVQQLTPRKKERQTRPIE